MPSISFLHVSDLHISKRPNLTSFTDCFSAGLYRDALTSRAVVSTHDPAVLLKLAEFVYEDYSKKHIVRRGEPIDALLLTGDLATTGSRSDLQEALKFVDGPEDPLSPATALDGTGTLAGAKLPPVWLLPGNHDRFRPARTTGYSPGGKLFYTVFQHHWDDEVKAFGTIGRGGLYVSVLAADFSLKHKTHREGRWFNKYGQGKVYKSILDRLVDRTRQVREELSQEVTILWALHYPPQIPWNRLYDETSR